MRLAIAQLNFTVGAFAANLARIAESAERAREGGARLLILPELATTGYPPRDLLTRPVFLEANLSQLEAIAELATDGLAILVGYVERNLAAEGKGLYNAAALLDGGRTIGHVRKCLLPSYDVFDEDRYFEPGGPVQPLVLDGISLGVHICEDLWNEPGLLGRPLYDRDPVDELAEEGVDCFINLSASPFQIGKPAIRHELARRKAIEHRRPFVYANQVGGNDELVFDGGSQVFDGAGTVVARAASFREELLLVDLPPSAFSGADLPAQKLANKPETVEEEATEALSLGLGDYCAKTGFKRVVIGLSGGIDSALTAALAVRALGPDKVLGVAMPSRFSSEGSIRDAEALARNLGIDYREVPIEPAYAAYLEMLEPVFDGAAFDVTEENLQARIRGAILMAISNKTGRLVLTTGNKSELAVGYCTLYGDMCGGLAVISDVPKTLVYQVSRHLNLDGELIPVSTLTKPPSAELRPDQKDSDSLPDYDLLDPILEALIEDACSVAEVAATTGAAPELVAEIARKVDFAEYKRRQAAPGIKVTSLAFGVGRRFPIVASWHDLPR